MEESKVCTKCGIEKPIEDFHKCKFHRGGRQPYCKMCKKKWAIVYRKTHGKEIKRKWREFYVLNSAKENRRLRKLYRANVEKEHKRSRKYRMAHKGETAERGRKYRASENGKASLKRSNHVRHAKQKSTEATLTAAQWTKILSMQGNRCNVCHNRFTARCPPTTDHIIPLSLGGGLTFENVQALCQSCNSRKGAKVNTGFIQTWL